MARSYGHVTRAAGAHTLKRRYGSRKLVHAALLMSLAPLAACGDISPTGVVADPPESTPVEAVYPSPGGVIDLAVVREGSSSVKLTWTQVDAGQGPPASYLVKYAKPSIDWKLATRGCESAGEALEVGAAITCTVEGLEPGQDYEFLLMSYRVEGTEWADAKYSNIAAASTSATDLAPGIWMDRTDIMRLPTSGAAWDLVLADAAANPGSAGISDQDSDHDVYTMAAALVCVRTGEYCTRARQGVLDAIGTERGGRWLAVGRNLAAYMIAADLLELRSDGDPNSAGTRVEEWAEGWLTKRLSDNNDTGVLRPFEPFHSGANAAAQEGLAYAAVAAYLGDEWALQRAWDAFRTFACDPAAPDRENIYLDPPVRDGWTHDSQKPCAVNPAGTVKRVPSGRPGSGSMRRIDGALVGDMRRGAEYQWTPGYTQYVWVGLEGFVPAAVILEKAGFPAFEVADRAVLRTHEYLLDLRNETGENRWFDGDRAREIVQLVNTAYGVSLPMNGAAGIGRTVGYTSWTHR